MTQTELENHFEQLVYLQRVNEGLARLCDLEALSAPPEIIDQIIENLKLEVYHLLKKSYHRIDKNSDSWRRGYE